MRSVDVVIPCYNYARFLPACVASVLGQEGVAVRVLVIDDTSSDDTPAVGRRLADTDRRVEFRRHASNRGHIETYNEGLLGWATADYSLMLSADDLLAPGALLRATRLMDAHPDVGMTYGMALVVVDDQPPPAPAVPAPEEVRVVPGADFMKHCFERAYNPVPTPTAVVRTRVQQRVGGYRPAYPHTGDFEMWMRFAAEGPIGIVRALQGYYRWHSSNMSRQYYGQPVGDLRELDQVSREILSGCAAKFSEAPAWAEAFSRSLALRAVQSASRAFNDGATDVCRAQLDFAAGIWPGVGRSGAWWKLAAKRLLGPSAWRRVRPLANRLRGVRDTGPRQLFWHGMKQGWWPG